jgi:restriction system protein
MNVQPPTVSELGPLVLDGLRRQGGRGSTADIRSFVEEGGLLTPEQLAHKHREGPGSEVAYRLRWALVDLRRRGLIERAGSRLWKLADDGPQS